MNTRTRPPLRRLVRLGGLLALPLLVATGLHAQSQFAGTYTGTINTKVSAGPVNLESALGAYIAIVNTSGSIDFNGTLSGTVAADGKVTFSGGSQFSLLGLTTATISGNRISSEYGAVVGNGTTQYRINPSTGFTAAAGGGSSGGGGGGSGNTAFLNGSFEGGGNPGSSWITLSTGNPSITGWTVTAGSIDYMGSVWQHSNGNRSLDMSGVSAGAIAQTFPTTSGQTYTVKFDLSGNPGYGTGTGVKQLRVSVDNSANTNQTYEFDTTGKSLSNMGWVEKTFTFTASGSSTTLTFTSLVNSAYGPALDNVRLDGETGATGSSGTTGSTTVLGGTAPTAPSSLTAFRNKVGQTFEFTVTGSASGSVWGTDVYTDDSSVAKAAVHAGVVAVGETKTVTVTILAGQSSYPASTRNGITTSNWGSWVGSYSFAGSTGATGTATAAPALAVDLSTINIPRTFGFGSSLILTVPISGVGPFTYQWLLNGVAISGATSATYSVPRVTAANAGNYSLRVGNSAGTTTIAAGSVTIAGSTAGVPTINLQPLNKIVAPGDTFALATSATGAGLSFQWFRNGTALSGETGPILLRSGINSGDAGSYTVRVSNSSGSITSQPATVSLTGNPAILSNISVRAAAAAGQVVTPGFALRGSGKKRVLIRAVGPTLSGFGVSGAMPDPKFSVNRIDPATGTATVINTTDGTDATATAVAAGVGAFAFASTDTTSAARVLELDAGFNYTVDVSGTGGGGTLLIEVYDAGNVSGGSKLVNVSVLTTAGSGNSTLILGFALRGDGQKTLLVRGAGPATAAFGINDPLADPLLAIVDSNSRTLLANNNWGQADYLSELTTASNFVGAFPFPDQSKDAASLVLLDSNATYTVQVVGADNGSGRALAEIYEVP